MSTKKQHKQSKFSNDKVSIKNNSSNKSKISEVFYLMTFNGTLHDRKDPTTTNQFRKAWKHLSQKHAHIKHKHYNGCGSRRAALKQKIGKFATAKDVFTGDSKEPRARKAAAELLKFIQSNQDKAKINIVLKGWSRGAYTSVMVVNKLEKKLAKAFPNQVSRQAIIDKLNIIGFGLEDICDGSDKIRIKGMTRIKFKAPTLMISSLFKQLTTYTVQNVESGIFQSPTLKYHAEKTVLNKINVPGEHNAASKFATSFIGTKLLTMKRDIEMHTTLGLPDPSQYMPFYDKAGNLLSSHSKCITDVQALELMAQWPRYKNPRGRVVSNQAEKQMQSNFFKNSYHEKLFARNYSALYNEIKKGNSTVDVIEADLKKLTKNHAYYTLKDLKDFYAENFPSKPLQQILKSYKLPEIEPSASEAKNIYQDLKTKIAMEQLNQNRAVLTKTKVTTTKQQYKQQLKKISQSKYKQYRSLWKKIDTDKTSEQRFKALSLKLLDLYCGKGSVIAKAKVELKTRHFLKKANKLRANINNKTSADIMQEMKKMFDGILKNESGAMYTRYLFLLSKYKELFPNENTQSFQPERIQIST